MYMVLTYSFDRVYCLLWYSGWVQTVWLCEIGSNCVLKASESFTEDE